MKFVSELVTGLVGIGAIEGVPEVVTPIMSEVVPTALDSNSGDIVSIVLQVIIAIAAMVKLFMNKKDWKAGWAARRNSEKTPQP